MPLFVYILLYRHEINKIDKQRPDIKRRKGKHKLEQGKVEAKMKGMLLKLHHLKGNEEIEKVWSGQTNSGEAVQGV